MKKEIIICERCGEVLVPERTKWLELSITDGNYYEKIPEGHESQGGYAFGSTCAKKTIEFTNKILNNEIPNTENK
jgi:hypothetical protein